MAPLDRLAPKPLTTALRNCGVLEEPTIEAVRIEQIGKDLGFNGTLWRVSPTYSHHQGSLPTSFIAKIPQSMAVAGKADSEARFYRTMSKDVGIRIPRCYLAEPDLLLLEDFPSSRCGDVAQGCSVDEARSVLESLAAFHAFHWASSKLQQHEWLPHWPPDSAQFIDRFHHFVPTFLARFDSELNDNSKKLTKQLLDKIGVVISKLAEAPATLIHRDTHLDNILFGPESSVVLIDWPSAAIGPAAIDVTRFVTTSLRPADFQVNHHKLIDIYFDSLQAVGVADYTREHLHRHLSLAGLRLWAGVVTGYGSADPAGILPRQLEVARVEVERLVHVMAAWNWPEFLARI